MTDRIDSHDNNNGQNNSTNNTICPLCCEELDLSDREFYPCKCGYQVCMWCWHRIRESESGLCPACRTPYGEDPHQFSAVDVEEVLKANKERDERAKKERIRSLQEHQHHQGHGHSANGSLNAGLGGGNNRSATIANGLNSGGNHEISGGGGGFDPAHNMQSLNNLSIEAPRDRNSLALMRVIRRNLVYAVGLPSNIANEDVLKRADYFGQYGRITKIVINRAQVTAAAGVDSRRAASASAYVTFASKDDTLSCILALDGFCLEGRSIRASYGTSKYCSSFIKNMRCNNPECTYLHEMGAAEDMFTKQEIQAGYVTSGRDVLARQQQIIEEQMRHGQAKYLPRKRIGGGGPSGTGKNSFSPVFPPPEYDEPSRQSALQVLPPPSTTLRNSTTPLTVASLSPTSSAANHGRSVSAVAALPLTEMGRSSTLGSVVQPTTAAATATATAVPRRKSTLSAADSAPLSMTAASVVATGRQHNPKAEADSHSTLTPLTPLKRLNAKTTSTIRSNSTSSLNDGSAVVNGDSKLSFLRNGNKELGGISASSSASMISTAPALPSVQHLQASSSSGHGGLHVIDNVNHARTLLGAVPAPANNQPGPVDLIDNSTIYEPSSTLSSAPAYSLSSTLGGEVFTGQLLSGSNSAIGSFNSRKWNDGGVTGSGHHELRDYSINNRSSSRILNEGGPISGKGTHPAHASSSQLIGGNVISNSAHQSPAGESFFPSSIASSSNSSSTLATILGVNLPTGSGSLHEHSTSSLWGSSTTINSTLPSAPSPLAALNSSAVPSQDYFLNQPASFTGGGGSSIGGGAIGDGSISRPLSQDNFEIGDGGTNHASDIALLQSLLPGVHITSGASMVGSIIDDKRIENGWSNSTTAVPVPSLVPLEVGDRPRPREMHNDSRMHNHNSGVLYSTGSSISAFGQNYTENSGTRRGSGIW